MNTLKAKQEGKLRFETKNTGGFTYRVINVKLARENKTFMGKFSEICDLYCSVGQFWFIPGSISANFSLLLHVLNMKRLSRENFIFA